MGLKQLFSKSCLILLYDVNSRTFAANSDLIRNPTCFGISLKLFKPDSPEEGKANNTQTVCKLVEQTDRHTIPYHKKRNQGFCIQPERFESITVMLLDPSRFWKCPG